MDRSDVVLKLVSGGMITGGDRRLLGGCVTRAEIGSAIALLLQRHGHFPLEAKFDGGMRLVVVPTGVRVARRRIASATYMGVTSVGAAVARYIDEELGPMCQGVLIRSTQAARPARASAHSPERPAR